MLTVLTVIGLLGLVVFVALSLYWLFMPARRTQAWPVALAGLVVWAVVAIILGFIALF